MGTTKMGAETCNIPFEKKQPSGKKGCVYSPQFANNCACSHQFAYKPGQCDPNGKKTLPKKETPPRKTPCKPNQGQTFVQKITNADWWVKKEWTDANGKRWHTAVADPSGKTRCPSKAGGQYKWGSVANQVCAPG